MTQPVGGSGGARPWLAVGAGLGIVSAQAQVLLLRELLVGFRGNELSLGLSLAAWLLWVAVGSILGGRLTRACREPGLCAAVCAMGLALLGLLLVGAMWFSRDLRHLFGVSWGEFIPTSRLVYAALALTGPVGLIAGLIFPLVCRAAELRARISAATIYLAESLGFLFGGVATFAAADLITPFVGACATAIVGAGFALAAVWPAPRGRLVAVGWLVAVVAAFAAGAPQRLESASLRHLYPGQHIVASAYSRYGAWVALAHGDQVSFYHNGALAFTAPDIMAAETLAHLSALQHPHPRRALLMGGGLDGSAAELLKHRGLRLDYLELDPAVITLARACPRPVARAVDQLLAQPRLRFSRTDGRRFIKRAAPGRYDLIIVNLPEPATALLNRFYTIEFFAEARRALTPHGVLCVGLPGAENYIGPEMQALQGSVYHSLRRVFADVVVTPGERALFFASPGRGWLSADAGVLARRWQARSAPAQYFSGYYLEAILPPERVAFVRCSCVTAPRTINHDFRPVGYLYDVALAGLAEGLLAPGAAGRLRWLPGPAIALLAMLLFVAPLLLSRRGQRLRRAVILSGVAYAGLAGMTLEICLLFAVQVINGHVYSQLGALVAVFMAGLAAGAWSQGRALAAGRRASARWVGWLVVGAATAFTTPLLLTAIATAPALGGWSSGVVIGLLMALGGAAVGSLFPLAVRLLGEDVGAAGAIYGADVTGAAVGALLTSLIALPVFGLAGACWIAGLLLIAAAVAAGLFLTGRASPSPPGRGSG